MYLSCTLGYLGASSSSLSSSFSSGGSNAQVINLGSFDFGGFEDMKSSIISKQYDFGSLMELGGKEFGTLGMGSSSWCSWCTDKSSSSFSFSKPSSSSLAKVESSWSWGSSGGFGSQSESFGSTSGSFGTMCLSCSNIWGQLKNQKVSQRSMKTEIRIINGIKIVTRWETIVENGVKIVKVYENVYDLSSTHVRCRNYYVL